MTDHLERDPYFKKVAALGRVLSNPPGCLFLENTKHYNLPSPTLPSSVTPVERPADLIFEWIVAITDLVPNLKQAVLHGIGEPLINKDQPKMISHLKGCRCLGAV